MRHVVHPGPPNVDRLELTAAHGASCEVTLAAGMPLEEAVGLAMQGWDSGWLWFENATVEALTYVIPALSPDDAHAAWYSDPVTFGSGTIDRLGMIVGRLETESFLHGHGLWTPEGGTQAMGHILAPRTVLAESVVARGYGVRGATFARLPDPETNFTLFRVTDRDCDGDLALLRIAPNQDFAAALDAAVKQLGWEAATAHGVGSFIDCEMSDGTRLHSLPSEFVTLDVTARADGTAPDPVIAIVGTDGARILEGAVAHGANPVLITCEIVLHRTG